MHCTQVVSCLPSLWAYVVPGSVRKSFRENLLSQQGSNLVVGARADLVTLIYRFTRNPRGLQVRVNSVSRPFLIT